MTPQTQLTLSKLFNGKEVRVQEQDAEYWWVVADLTKAWELHRNTLNDIINRHEWKFAGHYTTLAHGSCAGLTGVNETGVYLLMGAVHINQVKNEKAKIAIKKFNELWPELVKSFRKGEVVVQVPRSRQSTLDCINHQLDIADIAITRSGVPKEIAHKQAWALAAKETEEDLCTATSSFLKSQENPQLSLPEAIPTDQAEFESHFSVSQIAGFLKMSKQATHNLLESKNVICYKNGRYNLTTFGQKFGKEFPVTIGYPYADIRRVWIRYNPDLLKYLRLEGFDVQVETKVPE